MYKCAPASLQYSGNLRASSVVVRFKQFPVRVRFRFRVGLLLLLLLRLRLWLPLKFPVFRVVRTQEFGSEFRRHLPKLSTVLLASRHTIVHISTII